jgi:hypothetical protein
MAGKKIAFWLWTLICLAGIVVAGIMTTRDRVYNGTNIKFNTGRTLQISADTVTFQAAASNFFVLRKETGETIVGVPTQPPLGWSGTKYFVAGPQIIPGGTWLFPVGSASVIITSDTAVTVNVVEPEAGLLWFLMMFLGAIVWGLGYLLATT